jgi:hypothetical protein
MVQCVVMTPNPVLITIWNFMELFNKSGVLISSLLVMVGALIACQAKEDAVPPSTVIEAAAMQLGTQGHSAAERRLREWADLGSPVAQRELALRYLSNPAKRNEARQLFERRWCRRRSGSHQSGWLVPVVRFTRRQFIHRCRSHPQGCDQCQLPAH